MTNLPPPPHGGFAECCRLGQSALRIGILDCRAFGLLLRRPPPVPQGGGDSIGAYGQGASCQASPSCLALPARHWPEGCPEANAVASPRGGDGRGGFVLRRPRIGGAPLHKAVAAHCVGDSADRSPAARSSIRLREDRVTRMSRIEYRVARLTRSAGDVPRIEYGVPRLHIRKGVA